MVNERIIMNKNLILIVMVFGLSCFSTGNLVVKKYETVVLPQKNLALHFKEGAVKFFSTISGRSGFNFENTMNPEEDFKELFFKNTKNVIQEISSVNDVALSKKVVAPFNRKHITEFQDTLFLPNKKGFIKDFTNIEYVLIFDRFEIYYVDCGPNISNAMPCSPEIQFVVEYQIVSNESNELIQYGKVKIPYEYIRPQSGAFSKEYPSFINVRYEEWQVLTKLLLKRIFKNGPFA